jgi:hypothetical protein
MISRVREGLSAEVWLRLRRSILLGCHVAAKIGIISPGWYAERKRFLYVYRATLPNIAQTAVLYLSFLTY